MTAWERVGMMALVLPATLLLLSERSPLAAEGATRGPDLGVTILRSDADARGLVAVGQTATLSIGVHNLRGDADAHNATLTVVVPSGLAVKQARPAAERTERDKEGARLIWNLGTVAAGAFPRLFELDLQAGPDVKKGSELQIAASVATSDSDANDNNNRVAFKLAVENAAAYLNVESSLDSVPFTPDRPVEFNVQVRNLGTIPAVACELMMTLPSKVAFVSSEPAAATTNANVVVWKLGDIAPSGSAGLKAAISLDTSLRSAAYGFAGNHGLLEFNFAATTSTKQLDPGAGRLKVARYPEPAGSNVKVSLNVEGVENPGELPVGKDVTYEILYGNYGNEAARQVSVTLSLPGGLRLASAAPQPTRSSKSDRFPGGVISWDLGDLAVGHSEIIKSKVHVASIGNEEKFVEATIAAGAGHDVGSSDKAAYAWYGPPLARGALDIGGLHVSPWIVLLIVVAALAIAAFLLHGRRHRRAAE